MVNHTRLDCVLGSTGLIRAAVAQATHHTAHRAAFGKLLTDQPLMQNVLADLVLESEGSLALTMRLARAMDHRDDPHEDLLVRLCTAVGKYWICKRCPPMVNEAQECLGGAGYVEESILPRLYRQAPLNSIWEGSGNIQCLDVLRALSREPATREALFGELLAAKGAHPALDREVAALQKSLGNVADLEPRARMLVERMALALQASLLLRAGPGEVAEAFCASRLDGAHGYSFGTLAAGAPLKALIDRALPGR